MITPTRSLPTGTQHEVAGTYEPMTPVAVGAAAGVYLASYESAHAGHELTQRIRDSKISREHDAAFARLLAATVARHFPDFKPDLVASIPAKPDQEDRFRNIRGEVARRIGAADAGPVLRQTRVVADYRRMTLAQRRAVAGGRCAANDSIRNQSVLLIDDVVTSGAQATDALRAVSAAGAADLRFVAVASATGWPGDARTRRRITIGSP